MRKKWSGRSREQTPSRREKTSQLELAAYENVKYRVCMGVEKTGLREGGLKGDVASWWETQYFLIY